MERRVGPLLRCWPNGLVIDGHRLYWTDAQLDRIETAGLGGRFRFQLVQGATHPFGSTQLGGYLYWTDWRSNLSNARTKQPASSTASSAKDWKGSWKFEPRLKTSKPFAIHARKLTADAVICLFRAISYVCSCPDIPDNVPCTPSKRIHTILAWFERNCNQHDLVNRCSEHQTVG